MKRIYLVDSENVGDIWVPLLVSSQPEEQVIVFYTQKSPHMNYEHVRMLKETEKEAVFIKCFEGNNALDFQLVTELGYLLRGNEACEYVIVTNDTGFDAVVRYWTAKKMSVSRLSGKECYRKLTGRERRRETVQPAEEAPAAPSEPDEILKTALSAETAQEIADSSAEDELGERERSAGESGERAGAWSQPGEPEEKADARKRPAEADGKASGLEEESVAQNTPRRKDTAGPEGAPGVPAGLQETGVKEPGPEEVSGVSACLEETCGKVPGEETGARIRPEEESGEGIAPQADLTETSGKVPGEETVPQVRLTEESGGGIAPQADLTEESGKVPGEETGLQARLAEASGEETGSQADLTEMQGEGIVPQARLTESSAEVSTEVSVDTSGEENAAQTRSQDVSVREPGEEAAAQTVPQADGKEQEPEAQAAKAGCATEQDAGNEAQEQEETGDGPEYADAPEKVREIVNTLFRCISKDHLADFHNALVMFFGEETGKELYQEIKGDPEWTMEWARVPGSSQKEKFDVYCKMVFDHSELADSRPEDFSSFLLKSGGKRKNLNSLRAALQGQYGKDRGMKYYSLFKSHIKIMNRM